VLLFVKGTDLYCLNRIYAGDASFHSRYRVIADEQTTSDCLLGNFALFCCYERLVCRYNKLKKKGHRMILTHTIENYCACVTSRFHVLPKESAICCNINIFSAAMLFCKLLLLGTRFSGVMTINRGIIYCYNKVLLSLHSRIIYSRSSNQ
jgi:hypothetical protein